MVVIFEFGGDVRKRDGDWGLVDEVIAVICFLFLFFYLNLLIN